jgi:hypothetical protein
MIICNVRDLIAEHLLEIGMYMNLCYMINVIYDAPKRYSILKSYG